MSGATSKVSDIQSPCEEGAIRSTGLPNRSGRRCEPDGWGMNPEKVFSIMQDGLSAQALHRWDQRLELEMAAYLLPGGIK